MRLSKTNKINLLTRCILLAFVTAATVVDGNAQRMKRGARGGSGASIFKVGMNINYFAGNFPGDGSSTIGLNVGIAPTIPLKNQWYLKPELSYSQRGGSVSYASGFTGYTGDVTYKINFIDLPVLVGYKVNKLLAMEAGPFVALNIGGTIDFRGAFISGYGTFDSNALKEVNAGLAIGVKVGPVGIRYYTGFTSIASSEDTRLFLNEATTHTVQIYLQRQGQRRSR